MLLLILRTNNFHILLRSINCLPLNLIINWKSNVLLWSVNQDAKSRKENNKKKKL